MRNIINTSIVIRILTSSYICDSNNICWLCLKYISYFILDKCLKLFLNFVIIIILFNMGHSMWHICIFCPTVPVSKLTHIVYFQGRSIIHFCQIPWWSTKYHHWSYSQYWSLITFTHIKKIVQWASIELWIYAFILFFSSVISLPNKIDSGLGNS